MVNNKNKSIKARYEMCLKLFTLRSNVSFADLEQKIDALKLLNLFYQQRQILYLHVKLYMLYLLCDVCFIYTYFPAGNYMLKVENRNTITRCEVCILNLNIFHTTF